MSTTKQDHAGDDDLSWTAWYEDGETSSRYAVCSLLTEMTPDAWLDRFVIRPPADWWHKRGWLSLMVLTRYQGVVGRHVFDEWGVYCGALDE